MWLKQLWQLSPKKASIAQNYLVEMAHFCIFSAGYPAIYMLAWLHGAKQNVTTWSNTAYHEHVLGRSTEANCIAVVCKNCL